MTGLWNQAGVPHRGWHLIGTDDLGAPDHLCDMCQIADVRYVHEVWHSAYRTLYVGCDCAERLTQDYAGPAAAERLIKNRGKRRVTFLARPWRISASGNPFLNLKGRNLGLVPDRYSPGRWKWRVGGEFSRESYPDQTGAKLALFDRLDPIRAGVRNPS